MKLTSVTCPSCGSPVRIEPDQTVAECPFCGQQLHVDDGTRHMGPQGADGGSKEAGDPFERGWTQAQMGASEDSSDTDGRVVSVGTAKPKTVTMRGIVVVLVCIAVCAGLWLGLPHLFVRLRLPGSSVVSPVTMDVVSKMESSFTHVGYVESDEVEWEYHITEDGFLAKGGEVLDDDEGKYCLGANLGSGAYTCLITNLTGEGTSEFDVIRWNDAHDDCVTVGTLHLEPHEQVRAEFQNDRDELCVTYAPGLDLGITDVFIDDEDLDEDYDDEDYEDDIEDYEEDSNEEPGTITMMLDKVEDPSDSFADLNGVECWIAGKQYKEFKYTMQNYLLMDFPVMEMPELRNIPTDKGWKISATKTEESGEHGSRKYSIVVTGPSETPPKSVSREYVFTFAKNADSDAGIPESTER